ncbi:MAG: HesA/MoeB/ThiF family protein [Flavobacteriaceae bacterium]|nr:HesA/MoeB/ThiF family protein [Flavobacteriaceae bacterium]
MTEISKNNLYQRQTTLSEIGEIGQQKLQNAKISIIGCGGLGSIAAIYLAGSGVGNIHLIDFDTVGVSNLHRQIFYKTTDIGKPKVEVLASYIQSISPFVEVTFSNTLVSKNNVFYLISDVDIVLDCTDNLPIKYLLSDACVLKDKTLIYGSLYKFDGYVATFNHIDENGQRTANLRDAFPEIPIENIPNCAELGTLNTIVGMIGLLQANEVLKIVAKIGKPLVNELLIYNSLENTQFKMKMKPMNTKKNIEKIFKAENYKSILCDFSDGITISQENFKKILIENPKVKVISVLEDYVLKIPFKIDENVPLYEFENWLDELKKPTENYIVVCHQGIASVMAVHLFKAKYPKGNALSLDGGIANF